MIPGMMGMNPNVPTIKELWKNEKSKYRHWVIILAIGILVIAALTLTSFILNLIDKDEIIKNIKASYEKTIKASPNEYDSLAKNNFITYNVIFPLLITISILAGVIWYFVSLIEVYKQKNFAKLSSWPTLIVGVGAFISFIQLMTFTMSSQGRASLFTSNAAVFSFATKIIYILIYFAASSPISKVRKTFLISDRIEKLKNDPQFQVMQQQMEGMLKGGHMPNGPFGPVVASPKTNIYKNKKPSEVVPPPVKKENIQLKRLKGLSVEKLKEVAKRLSISGYKTMKKDELIEAILRVT